MKMGENQRYESSTTPSRCQAQNSDNRGFLTKILDFFRTFKFAQRGSCSQNGETDTNEENDTNVPCKVLVQTKKDLTSKEIARKVKTVGVKWKSSCWNLTGSSVYNDQVLDAIFREHQKPDGLHQLTLNANFALGNIPTSIGLFDNLIHLNLSDNAISEVPWSMVYMKNLETLDLSQNLLQSFPKSLSYLQKLKSLNLKSNLISNIPSEIIRLVNLEVLCLSGNPLIPKLCSDNVDQIFEAIRLRQNRRNAWKSFTPNLTGLENQTSFGNDIKSLQDLCVDAALDYKVDYFLARCIPPRVKEHLSDISKEKSTKIHVAKCSRCAGFFSNLENYECHQCPRS